MTLRERLEQQEQQRARQQVASLLQDLERATTLLCRAAHTTERLAQAIRWQRSVVIVAAAAVLVAICLIALPSHWWLSSAEQQQLELGRHFEKAWTTVSDQDRTQLKLLLRLQTSP